MAKLQSAEEELLRVLDEKRGLELELRCAGVGVGVGVGVQMSDLAAISHASYPFHPTHHTSHIREAHHRLTAWQQQQHRSPTRVSASFNYGSGGTSYMPLMIQQV